MAALSIKGSSAILNFPELANSLPRPSSLSPRDVQAAAAKAAHMDNFEPINSASSGSSLSSLASTIESSAESESEELCEIIKLPRLGTSCDTAELVFTDSEDGGWLYRPPWMQGDGQGFEWIGELEDLFILG